MKTKENRSVLQIYKLRTFIRAVICLLLILFSFPLSASGIENEFLVENYNLIESHAASLGADASYYSSLDSDPQKSVSTSVAGAINVYRKQLLDLQSHPEAASRSLAREIALSSAKGRAAGRISWIFFYHRSRLQSDESIKSLDATYEQYASEIALAAEEAVLEAKTDVMCAELNNAAFTLLLRELSLPDDSLASSSVIAGGIEKVSNLRDSSLISSAHATIYEEIKAALLLSRASDSTSAELRALYPMIRAGEDFQSDPAVALFTYKLKNAQSIREVNDAFASTVCALLSFGNEGDYSRIYLAGMQTKINEASAEASKEGRTLVLSHLFASYTLDRAKASAKDELYALIYANGRGGAKLDEIEKEFNSESGRIDACENEFALEQESTRGKYIILCYDAYLDACEQIEIALAPYEKQKQLALAEAIYTDSANAIRKLASSLEFENLCDEERERCSLRLGQTVAEAKAERFLLDHAKVISTPVEKLSPADEIHLRRALDDYTRLEKSVSEMLISQIDSIAVKYNSVLAIKIRSMLAEDALFLDLCDAFCKEIDNLPRTIIADYYNNCDLVLEKAEALCKMIQEYRELCKGELYASFNSSEKEDLVEVCRSAASKLASLDVNDKGIFGSELADVSADAKIDAWQIHEQARIRISSRNSSNAEIKAIMVEANVKINASRNTNEISSIADKAIFKINRLLTSDAISAACERELLVISKMKFLHTSSKDLISAKIKEAARGAKAEALTAENLTVLSFVWDSFSKALTESSNEAKQKDLALCRDAHVELFEAEVKKLAEKIRSMAYITTSKSEEYFNKITEARSSFKSGIGLAASSEEVAGIYGKALDILCSIEISADTENLTKYKEIIASSLEDLKGDPKNYSTENYNTIIKIIKDAKADLESIGSIPKCDSLLEDTKKRLALVNDLLDDAADRTIDLIEEKMKSYRSRSNLYSPSALSLLEKISKDAIDKIKAYTSISDVPTVERIAVEALQALAAVNCDYHTTLPDGSITLEGSTRYPADFNAENGLWGVLYSPNSLPSDATLSILPTDAENLREIQKLIRKAARQEKLLTFGYNPDEDLLKELKHSRVISALDISLTGVENLPASARLGLLLSDEFSREKILGVVFVDSQNNVEFYSTSQEESLISLNLTHFSKFYIVTESTINLMPLIILLTILITFEFILLIFILILRFNRKRKETDQMLPMLSSCFLPLTSFSLTQIKPSGAITTTVLLSVAALALGCAVAMLARLELREYRAGKQKNVSPAPAPSQPLLSSSTRIALPEKRAALKAAEEPDGESYYPSSTVAVEDYPPPSDEDFEQISDDDSADAYTCFGKARYKAEINLDVIEDKFEDGDLVTLDALKRKKLVPKRTDYVKILARGALTKPLIVEANDFSRAAEEMLEALGGEAIRVRH